MSASMYILRDRKRSPETQYLERYIGVHNVIPMYFTYVQSGMIHSVSHCDNVATQLGKFRAPGLPFRPPSGPKPKSVTALCTPKIHTMAGGQAANKGRNYRCLE